MWAVEGRRLQSGIADAQYKLHLLGRFRLQRLGPDGAWDDIALSLRRAEWLLAHLALQPDAVSRDKLATLFWGDSTDEDARRSLRAALARIRSEAGDDLVFADRSAVWLNPHAGVWTDYGAVAQACDGASGELDRGSADRLAGALALYTGDVLSGLDQAWIEPFRRDLRERTVRAWLALAQFRRAASDYDAAIACAHAALAIDAANEDAHQHVMVCRLALGDRSAALAQYDACVRALRDALGVTPSEATRKLHSAALHAPAARPQARPGIRPPRQATGFVGRAAELDALRRLLSTGARVVTVTGVAGCGKTRLAVEAARAVEPAFADGVCWADLTNADGLDGVAGQILQALGARESPHLTALDALIEHAAAWRALLVLDNCEHVIDACAQVADRLQASAPGVTMLATGREALNIPGERVLQLAPLGVPPDDAPARIALDSEAVRLFALRAAAARPGFSLSDASARAAAAICRRLDGIPLAIELAAARARSMSIDDIERRLDDRFSLLTQGYRTALPRQQTLRAALDWSHDLLSAEEKIALRRLSVFAGGFALQAAEAVCGAPPLEPRRVLGLVARLADKSLVTLSRGAGRDPVEWRHGLLETVRQYAMEQLRARGDAERGDVERRHARYFAELAQQGDAALSAGGDTERWLGRLDAELDNLRAAAAWALANRDDETALRLIGSLPSYWSPRGHFSEGRAWLERAAALDVDGAPADVSPLRAEVLSSAGLYAVRQNDAARAQTLFAQGLALARRIGDRRREATLLSHLGLLAHNRLDFDAARDHYTQALAIRRSLGLPASVAISLNLLGLLAAYERDYEPAEQRLSEGLELCRVSRSERTEAVVLANLGDVAAFRGQADAARAFHERSLAIAERLKLKHTRAIVLNRLALHDARSGETQRARERCEESFAIFLELHDRRGMAEVAERLAAVIASRGAWPAAVKLAACASAARAAIGVPLAPPEADRLQPIIAAAGEAMPSDAFEAAWREGSGEPVERALSLAA